MATIIYKTKLHNPSDEKWFIRFTANIGDKTPEPSSFSLPGGWGDRVIGYDYWEPTVKGDRTYWLVWESQKRKPYPPKVEQFTITYADRFSSWKRTYKAVKGESTPRPLDEPKRAGYKFTGFENWTPSVEGNATYYAQWMKLPDPKPDPPKPTPTPDPTPKPTPTPKPMPSGSSIAADTITISFADIDGTEEKASQAKVAAAAAVSQVDQVRSIIRSTSDGVIAGKKYGSSWATSVTRQGTDGSFAILDKYERERARFAEDTVTLNGAPSSASFTLKSNGSQSQLASSKSLYLSSTSSPASIDGLSANGYGSAFKDKNWYGMPSNSSVSVPYRTANIQLRSGSYSEPPAIEVVSERIRLADTSTKRASEIPMNTLVDFANGEWHVDTADWSDTGVGLGFCLYRVGSLCIWTNKKQTKLNNLSTSWTKYAKLTSRYCPAREVTIQCAGWYSYGSPAYTVELKLDKYGNLYARHGSQGTFTTWIAPSWVWIADTARIKNTVDVYR